jgi:hypothetical protein
MKLNPFARSSHPSLDHNWKRFEVTRFEDIVTMNYEGGRRIAVDQQDTRGMYYQIIGYALEDLGFGRGIHEYEHLLTSHKERTDALAAGEKLATTFGVALIDLTGK